MYDAEGNYIGPPLNAQGQPVTKRQKSAKRKSKQLLTDMLTVHQRSATSPFLAKSAAVGKACDTYDHEVYLHFERVPVCVQIRASLKRRSAATAWKASFLQYTFLRGSQA